MYAGRVACCHLVSYGEYADGIDRQKDGQITLFAKDAASIITQTDRMSAS